MDEIGLPFFFAFDFSFFFLVTSLLRLKMSSPQRLRERETWEPTKAMTLVTRRERLEGEEAGET